MKQFIIALFVGLLSQFSVNAQGTVAHIDMEQLYTLMPENDQAELELSRLRQAYQQNFETSYREYQARFVKYEDEAPTLSPEEDAKRKSELELMERNLAQSQQNIEKQIAEKKELLYGPIRIKARELVTKIAEDLGFLYVLDSSKDNGLVMAKGKDLMPDVRRSLGNR
ncbi:OmpH family outer membrane protein [Leeuwenhoekiella parthenopeia]|uniref:OmpH family outer membrane protein n=1 Tax=Leeuwenhoekiella parthenopeia TaxID=2890320 RepID=A0ABS8GTI8_9FLAO|nr:OmpH family outer membrane protein [Leeuwenhoekiella parthenopeia]MCC4213315.1 OmpH family outer membrane protein [Leeuwenhoekiella parthenopeia]